MILYMLCIYGQEKSKPNCNLQNSSSQTPWSEMVADGLLLGFEDFILFEGRCTNSFWGRKEKRKKKERRKEKKESKNQTII